jgi:intracellular septation protein A
MAYVTGFLPWILYWILIGNVDFRLAVCIVLAAAVIIQVISWRRGQPPRSLDVGSLVVFVLLAVAAFVVDDGVLEMWMQPLSNLGLLLVALGGMLLGRPFVRDFAISTVDAETARSDGFRYITTGMTWMWIVALALMTVVSAIPPLVSADAE